MMKTKSMKMTNNHNSGGGQNNQLLIAPNFQTSMYATNGSLIKDFISKKEHFVDESTERRPALINRYGFIAPLIDGFNSDGNKRLEINLPDSADLSINQNGGFSVFFWLLCKKQPGGFHRFIMKRGNTMDELTPSVGILPNGTNIFIKMNSSKHRIENLFSNKKLEANRMYCLTVTFAIDYMNDLTDISLYLDGLLDSQITVPGEPVHNQGNLYVGRSDNLNYGFVGCVADIILVPRVLDENEVNFLQKQCLGSLNLKRVFGSYEIFAKKFERDTLIQKYVQYTGNPHFVIENLEMDNEELREIVKKFDNDLREDLSQQSPSVEKNEQDKQNNHHATLHNLQMFLGSEDSDLSIFCKKISTNARFIYTVLFLVNGMEDDIAVNRVLNSFEILTETLHIQIDQKNLATLAEIIHCYNNKLIQLQQFFKNIRFYTTQLFPEINYSPNIINSNGNSHSHGNYYANNFFGEANSVELHENLLLNSQNFKNYIDDDLERDLAKSSFTIRSLYSRTKSARPMTGKGYINSKGNIEEGDTVNQQFDLIPEKKNEYSDVEEDEDNMVIVDSPQEDSEKVKGDAVKEENEIDMEVEDKNKKEGENIENKEGKEQPKKNEDKENNEKVEDKSYSEIKKEENSIKSEEANREANESKKEEGNSNSNVNEDKKLEEKIEEKKENPNENEKEKENMNNPQPEGKIKENNDANTNVKAEADISKTPVSEKKEEKEKLTPASENPENNKNLSNPIDSPKGNGNSLYQTNFDDIVSNFDQKVMIKSSDRDTQDRFLDPENFMSVNGLVTPEPQEDRHEEVLESSKIDPKYPSDWCEGNFELVINHCYDCHLHKTTTRHFEFTFIDKFNELGDYLKSLFPNIKVIGNHSKPDYLSCFDVYLRGVGPRLDEKDRYFLYRRINTKKFPQPQEIGDKLIALAMLYGSSHNMETAQTQYLRAYQEKITKPFKGAHDYPAQLNEEAEKVKQEYENRNKKPPQIDPERTKFFCQNWGCGTVFVQVENGPHKCAFHPGVWQFGSYHGYWPEAWSCCERGWTDPGCTKGPHKGVRMDKRLMLCLNHGEPNPSTSHPDSACGVYFTAKEAEGCKYHPGALNRGVYSCCGSESPEGCVDDTHSTADWPDEKAKLYFYPKPLINPGLDKKKISVGQQVSRCDYFKAIKPYDNPITKMELLKMKREKEKDEPKYCLRWACEKVFKETENHEKACLCHPGKWDHGSTGTKMAEFVRELGVYDPKSLDKQTILWRPHWTCCRGDWEAPGCRRMKHRGPLVEEYKTNPRKFRWPDPRLRLYFPKVVSDKWKNFLQKYMYPESRVKQICRNFFKGSRKTISDLPELCDQLRLYLLVVSDNAEYQMKFMDIATQSEMATKFLVSGGCVDPEKFINYWFMEYEKIAEVVLSMPETKK